MFKSKCRKLKNQIIENAKLLKLKARDNFHVSPEFLATIQELIDDLETAKLVKDKDKQVTLKVLQSNFDDIVSAYFREETAAIESCNIFIRNLKKMNVSDKMEVKNRYSPEEIGNLFKQRLQNTADNYSNELARLNKEKEDCARELRVDRINVTIARKYQTICKTISDTEEKFKSFSNLTVHFEDQIFWNQIIKNIQCFTEAEFTDFLNANMFNVDDDGVPLCGIKIKDIYWELIDRTLEERLPGPGDHYDPDPLPIDDLFRNVEKVRDGYSLEALYYKYKVQDESEERDKLVSEVKELLKKRYTTSEVERMTLDGDIRAKNNQVEALTQSIKRYQSAWNAATQKTGIAQRVITEKDIFTAQCYNLFAKEFEANLQEYAMELSKKAKAGEVETDDLSVIDNLINAIFTDQETVFNSSDKLDDDEFDRPKKKYSGQGKNQANVDITLTSLINHVEPVYPICCIESNQHIFCQTGKESIWEDSSDVTLSSSEQHNEENLEYLSCGLYFELRNDGYIVKGIGKCKASLIKIPSEFKSIPVVGIAENAFKECSSLNGVTIPKTVKRIGDEAFSKCLELKIISMERGVLEIGSRAFYDCKALTSITIPDSVTSIGDHAFCNCRTLTSINIPDSVTLIGDSAFSECSSLVSINIPNSLISIGNYVFAYCVSLTSISIPISVGEIGASAFSDCTSLISISISHSVTSFGANAFNDCSSLTSIVIPKGTTSIGFAAFSGCTSLTSINIPFLLKEICANTFSGCTSLTSIFIPDNVNKLGAFAFKGCTSLISITIPDSVTSIDNGVFSGCTSLASIVLPETLLCIGDSAFWNCFRLKTVYFSGTPEDWREIKIEAFNDYLLSADLYYYSEEKPSEKGKFWRYLSGEPAKWDEDV